MDFKTSHVKVYRYGYMATIRNYRISKHLMLKFIKYDTMEYRKAFNFKTSHVKVYLNSELTADRRYHYFKTSHVKVYPTHFLYFIQSTISDFSVFINILKFFTSHRAICQKNSQNHCNTTVFADSRNFTLIGGW